MNTDSKPELTSNPPQDNPVDATNQAIGSSKKGLTKKSKIAIGVAGVVAIAMLGFGGYSLYKNLGANASTAIEVRNGPLYGYNGFVDMAGRTSIDGLYIDSDNNSADDISFSQDGSRVVYSVKDYNDGGLSDVYTATSDNKDISLVADGVDLNGSPRLSPDKRHVAYKVAGRETVSNWVWGITTVDLTTGESFYLDSTSDSDPLVSYWSDIKYSSDSKSVIYTAINPTKDSLLVCRASLDLATRSCQSAPDAISSEVSGYNQGGVLHGGVDSTQLSNDGSKLAVSYSRYGDDEVYSYGMKVFDISNDFTLVSETAEINSGLTMLWSPDDSRLVYGTWEGEGGDRKFKLNILEVSTGRVDRFLEGYYNAGRAFKAWQPIPKNGKQSPLPIVERYRQHKLDFITCELTGVDQASFVVGSTINASVKLTGNRAHSSTTYKGSSIGVRGVSTVDISGTTLEPGEEKIWKLPPYVVKYVGHYDEPLFQAELIVHDEDGYQRRVENCGPSFALPQPPVSILGSAAKTVQYGKSIELKAATRPGSYAVAAWLKSSDDTFLWYSSVDSKGIFRHNYTDNKDVDLYASINRDGAKSKTISIKVVPFVGGKTTKTVAKNKTATISGNYTPNSKITLYMRNSKDKVGKYPIKKTITVDRYGKFSYKFKADKKYKSYNFYLAGSNGANTSIYTYKVK